MPHSLECQRCAADLEQELNKAHKDMLQDDVTLYFIARILIAILYRLEEGV